MKTYSALLVYCAGNSSITGEFPSQRSVMRSFDAFFHSSAPEQTAEKTTEKPVIWDAITRHKYVTVIW